MSIEAQVCAVDYMRLSGRVRGVKVPVAIGGTGLPDAVHFRTDLPHAGLANVGPTLLNLLGLEAPSSMVPSLLAQS